MATWDLESSDPLWWFVPCCSSLIMPMETRNGGKATFKYSGSECDNAMEVDEEVSQHHHDALWNQ